MRGAGREGPLRGSGRSLPHDQEQYKLDAGFREAGICGVLGIGSTPGITNILARVALDQLDRVERLDVRIGSGDFRPKSSSRSSFVPPYSIRTIFDECTLEPMVFRNGRWSALAPMSGHEVVDFPRRSVRLRPCIRCTPR